MDGGELVSVTELGQRILAQPDIEGLTVSGGEPLLQATALCALIDLLRRGRDLGVIVYSGYTLDELRRGGAGPGAEDLLSRIDLLVDGPYVEALNDGGGLRGSANQRAHFLTPRYARYAARYGGGQRAVELHLHRDHAFLAGIPGPETLARWRAGFSAEGPSGGSGQAVEHPKR
jgi:anaerobic ribonucleoside-triphosphate reductase activating protein